MIPKPGLCYSACVNAYARGSGSEAAEGRIVKVSRNDGLFRVTQPCHVFQPLSKFPVTCS
jgi:hypothetical protein